MSITWAYRSDTTSAYHAEADAPLGSADFFSVNDTGTALGEGIVKNIANPLTAVGLDNWSDQNEWSMLFRIKPTNNNITNGGLSFLGAPSGRGTPGTVDVRLDQTLSTFIVNIVAEVPFIALISNATLATSWNPTTTNYYDILMTFEDTTTAAFNMYIDGSFAGSLDASATYSAYGNRTNKRVPTMVAGPGLNSDNGPFRMNEWVIWNEIIDPTNVTLVDPDTGVTSTGQSLNGQSRTGWVDTTFKHGHEYTDPGIANVKSGTNYIVTGTTVTGTLVSADPGVSNVLSGTGYTIESVSLTGTYNPPTYTDPGVGNVKDGINYIFNDSTQTGSLAVPSPSSATAGTADLNGIKEQVRYVLSQANTTGSSTIDLSANLTRRVQKVLKINPERIEFQASFFPLVTCFIDNKSLSLQDIAVDKPTAKRKAEVDIQVVGMVWNNNLTDINEDPADEDIQYLMENTERVLRSYNTLNNTVNWFVPVGSSFYNLKMENQVHLRTGILTYRASIFY